MISIGYIGAVVLGYLLGSIPFGLLIARRKAKIDIRQYGSGKVGMTNVLRTAGVKAAAATLVLDLIKGVLAVLFAGLIVSGEYPSVGHFSFEVLLAQVLAALAAIAGHNWSVFLKFRGGRGVATFFGGLAALCLPAAVFGFVILTVVMALTRYASLGSLAGTVSTYIILIPLMIVQGYPFEYLAYTLTGTMIIAFMHRGNIIRLLSGTERRLGEKAEGLLGSSTNAGGLR